MIMTAQNAGQDLNLPRGVNLLVLFFKVNLTALSRTFLRQNAQDAVMDITLIPMAMSAYNVIPHAMDVQVVHLINVLIVLLVTA